MFNLPGSFRKRKKKWKTYLINLSRRKKKFINIEENFG